MFFVLSKVLGFFAVPSTLILFIGLAGVLALVLRRVRLGAGLMALSIVLLAVVGLSPLGNALMLPLEQRFPVWDETRGPPDGIIVLGGAMLPATSAARGAPQLNEAAERMTSAVALARRFPSARIVFSGGSGALGGGGLTEAEFARPLFESLGLPADRVLFESRSRSTAENAELTRALVAPKPGQRWLLITSAHHMPRAVGCFRHAGFTVEPYPVDWRTRGPQALAAPFDQVSDGLARTDAAAHEWLGLIAYWATGRIATLFPAP
jgi:uncharacterized SAM-binding protein YcdF (DUF218 family)